jgi:hypothetical protein
MGEWRLQLALRSPACLEVRLRLIVWLPLVMHLLAWWATCCWSHTCPPGYAASVCRHAVGGAVAAAAGAAQPRLLRGAAGFDGCGFRSLCTCLLGVLHVVIRMSAKFRSDCVWIRWVGEWQLQLALRNPACFEVRLGLLVVAFACYAPACFVCDMLPGYICFKGSAATVRGYGVWGSGSCIWRCAALLASKCLWACWLWLSLVLHACLVGDMLLAYICL